MRTGSMTPPRDGNGSDDELLAKVIPLRRRGPTLDERDDPRGPSDVEREPVEREPAADAPEAPALAMERSIWDRPSAQLVRRPQGKRQRARRALKACALRVRRLPKPMIASAVTGMIALAALAIALSTVVFWHGGASRQDGGSVLHASVLPGFDSGGAKARSTTSSRHPTANAGVHRTESVRHHEHNGRHQPTRSVATSNTAQSTAASTGATTGATAAGGEGSGTSGGSTSQATYTPAVEERGTAGGSTSPSATPTPAAATPPAPSKAGGGSEATAASGEFGFEG